MARINMDKLDRPLPSAKEFRAIAADRLDMHDAILPAPEARAIFSESKGFPVAGERDRRLDDNKAIHDRFKFSEPQFQEVQFVEQDDAIVNHFTARLPLR